MIKNTKYNRFESLKTLTTLKNQSYSIHKMYCRILRVVSLADALYCQGESVELLGEITNHLLQLIDLRRERLHARFEYSAETLGGRGLNIFQEPLRSGGNNERERERVSLTKTVTFFRRGGKSGQESGEEKMRRERRRRR